MNVFVLFIDPDNGKLDDVETFAFSTEMAALRARGELIEDDCESVLTIRPMRVSDSWVINSVAIPKDSLKIGDDE